MEEREGLLPPRGEHQKPCPFYPMLLLATTLGLCGALFVARPLNFSTVSSSRATASSLAVSDRLFAAELASSAAALADDDGPPTAAGGGDDDGDNASGNSGDQEGDDDTGGDDDGPPSTAGGGDDGGASSSSGDSVDQEGDDADAGSGDGSATGGDDDAAGSSSSSSSSVDQDDDSAVISAAYASVGQDCDSWTPSQASSSTPKMRLWANVTFELSVVVSGWSELSVAVEYWPSEGHSKLDPLWSPEVRCTAASDGAATTCAGHVSLTRLRSSFGYAGRLWLKPSGTGGGGDDGDDGPGGEAQIAQDLSFTSCSAGPPRLDDRPFVKINGSTPGFEMATLALEDSYLDDKTSAHPANTTEAFSGLLAIDAEGYVVWWYDLWSLEVVVAVGRHGKRGTGRHGKGGSTKHGGRRATVVPPRNATTPGRSILCRGMRDEEVVPSPTLKLPFAPKPFVRSPAARPKPFASSRPPPTKRRPAPSSARRGTSSRAAISCSTRSPTARPHTSSARLRRRAAARPTAPSSRRARARRRSRRTTRSRTTGQ